MSSIRPRANASHMSIHPLFLHHTRHLQPCSYKSATSRHAPKVPHSTKHTPPSSPCHGCTSAAQTIKKKTLTYERHTHTRPHVSFHMLLVQCAIVCRIDFQTVVLSTIFSLELITADAACTALPSTSKPQSRPPRASIMAFLTFDPSTLPISTWAQKCRQGHQNQNCVMQASALVMGAEQFLSYFHTLCYRFSWYYVFIFTSSPTRHGVHPTPAPWLRIFVVTLQ